MSERQRCRVLSLRENPGDVRLIHEFWCTNAFQKTDFPSSSPECEPDGDPGSVRTWGDIREAAKRPTELLGRITAFLVLALNDLYALGIVCMRLE